MRYWWLAWWQARRYSLLASMTCRRYSSGGTSNGTPRTRLGGPGMRAGHPQGQLHQGPTGRRGEGPETAMTSTTTTRLPTRLAVRFAITATVAVSGVIHAYLYIDGG
jgi:hypothetical protein